MEQKRIKFLKNFDVPTLLVLVLCCLQSFVFSSSYLNNFGLSDHRLGYVSDMVFMMAASTTAILMNAMVLILHRKKFNRPFALPGTLGFVLVGLCFLLVQVFHNLVHTTALLVVLGALWGVAKALAGLCVFELVVYVGRPLAIVTIIAASKLMAALFGAGLAGCSMGVKVAVLLVSVVVCAFLMTEARKRVVPYDFAEDRSSMRAALGNSLTPMMASAFITLVVGLLNVFAFFASSSISISANAPLLSALVVALLVILFSVITNQVPNSRIIYLGVFPATITIFLFLPFFGQEFTRSMSTVIYAADAFTALMAMYLCCTATFNARANYLGVGSVYHLLYYGALVIGWGLGALFANFQDGQEFVHVAAMCVVCVYVLGIIVVLYGFRTSRERSTQGETDQSPSVVAQPAPRQKIRKQSIRVVVKKESESFEESVMQRAEELTREYGLTAREKDVLVGLAQGNTAAGIAEHLVLSTSTVQGYIKQIYQKLGVNRKQQVIDLFLPNNNKH